MPVESWTQPDDVAALAAEAKAQIDAVLTRLDEAERDAFWASIGKCYNTPYNDPKPRKLVRSETLAVPQPCPVTEAAPVTPHPVTPHLPHIASLVAMTQTVPFAAEHHAG